MSLSAMVDMMVWVLPIIVPLCIVALMLRYAAEIAELGDDDNGNEHG